MRVERDLGSHFLFGRLVSQLDPKLLVAEGFEVTVARQGETFARLVVPDRHEDTATRMELGVDWRAYPPTMLEIGPVLHSDDAVANKVCALYGRGEVRDYVDVDGILQSGRYSVTALLRLAAEHDPGFDAKLFPNGLLWAPSVGHRVQPCGFGTFLAWSLRTSVLTVPPG